MKLLLEVTEDIEFLKEDNDVTGNKDYFIAGIFMQADVRNRNGRVYPRDVLAGEVNRYQDKIRRKQSYGELGHPATPQLNLDRVSHYITELYMDGNDVYGKAKIIDTIPGRTVKKFLEEGCLLGVSSRGVGSVKEQRGAKIVQEDFMMTAVDIVADPSAPDAFVQAIFEQKEWIIENGVWVEKDLVSAKKTINEKFDEEVAAKLLESFLNSLSNR